MLQTPVTKLAHFLKALAGLMLVGMMLLTCADVAGNFFGHPVLGSEEVVGLMASLLIAFTLPAAHRENAHMGIDLLYVKFPKNIKKMNNIILSLISSLFFSITAWECYLYGNELKKTGEVSATLEISTYYIVYAISFACAVLALTLLVQFLNLFKEGHYE